MTSRLIIVKKREEERELKREDERERNVNLKCESKREDEREWKREGKVRLDKRRRVT
jgi:hypothetical protein